MNYCNSVFFTARPTVTFGTYSRSRKQLPDWSLCGTRRRDGITPVLTELHWLLVWWCVDFELAILVYRCLHGLAPTYLSEDCRLAASDSFRRRLRSAEMDTCLIPRTQTQLGEIAFSLSPVYGFGTVCQRLYAFPTPNSWNSTNDCWKLTCLGLLKQMRIIDCFYSAPYINLLTYLLQKVIR